LITNKNSYPKFKNAYYPPLFDKHHVKDSYKLNKNIIVTGPNASGKTTFLKTSMINILFSQQFGFGFYEKAYFKPYKYLHCYLNIPDTSARDSLFQAEARRCKEILDSINNSNKDDEHFCIFDELYSGTNPYEAIASAFAFLYYLSSQTNVKFMLTTHFLDLCDYLKKHKNIKNMNMVTFEKDNRLIYTYKVKQGISRVQGGIKVLRDLDYPDYIIKMAYNILNK
jgi:DNA mismatch repair ATPase MutS